MPSAKPEVPEPAKVDTTPAGVILRIRWLNLSAAYTVPPVSTAKPSGQLNFAAVPVPSANPETPAPASVETMATHSPLVTCLSKLLKRSTPLYFGLVIETQNSLPIGTYVN